MKHHTVSTASSSFGRAFVAALVLALSWSSVPAQAGEPWPWHAGVAQARKEAAQRDLDEGNRLIHAQLFRPSLSFYQRALASWDHPGLHLNIAKVLMNIDRSDLALPHFWLAFRYGALGPDLTEQAIRYARLLLDSDLVHLVVVSHRSGTIRLGERDLLVGPGRWEGVAPAGAITLTSTAYPKNWSLTVRAGHRLEVVWLAAGEAQESVSDQNDTTRAELMRAVLGFVVATPTADQIAQAPMPMTRYDKVAAELATPLERSAEARRLCHGASGELASICRAYDRDLTRLEARFKEVSTSLSQLSTKASRGGLVELLQ